MKRSKNFKSVPLFFIFNELNFKRIQPKEVKEQVF